MDFLMNHSWGKVANGIIGFVAGGILGIWFVAFIITPFDIIAFGLNGFEPTTFATLILLAILIFGSFSMMYGIQFSQRKLTLGFKKCMHGFLWFMLGEIGSMLILGIIAIGIPPSLIFFEPYATALVGIVLAFSLIRRTK
jgi:hypothetical protein